MFEAILDFILRYKYIFIFYLIVIILLIINRKKLAFQAKIIILYRMKWGLKWMDKYAQKFREWIILLGYIGVGAGYIGLIFISCMLIKNVYDLVATPAVASAASIVYPGMKIPGIGVLSFDYFIIVIFLIAIVHEFSHGIVARAHNIKVKNTGIVLFGPIIGAFVEPDEKKLQKEKDIKQYSVLAAGSFSNILLALIAILLLNFAFMPLQETMTEPHGFTFDDYYGDSSPFSESQINPGTLITGINDQTTTTFQDFNEVLICSTPGEEIIINTPQKNYPIILGTNPDNPKKALIGIQSIHNEVNVKAAYQQGFGKIIYNSLVWVNGFLRWLFLLSLGIGLFNLLPLPIVDGGRMTQVFLHRLRGEKKGENSYRKISLFFLLVLLLNLFYPLLVKMF
tara:strand:+ start:67 stop:1254 length:1188 start_codon:yes stop_codon:yes gene_type:complete